MIDPYFARLACLSLAVFFLVHLAAGAAISLSTAAIVRMVDGMRPRLAAGILLTLRLFPLGLGWFAVAACCVPSYLWLEPRESAEEVGHAAVLAAALALAILSIGLWRGVRLARRSHQWAQRMQAGCDAPVLAIAGFLRTRLVVSPILRERLPADELAVALRHEDAHRAAFDNLKRLLVALSPGLLPGVYGFAGIERHWQRLLEWAADDDAVEGHAARAVALASALVRVARMGRAAVPLASGLLDGDGLTQRVERLLAPPRIAPCPAQPLAVRIGAGLAVIACVASLALHPASLVSAHELLEQLIR